MEVDPKTIPWRERYRILTGSIVPRPIGWVSTLSAAGVNNIAPFSFFNAACAAPMIVTFAPMRDSDTGNKKDTLQNIEATGEYVVNIACEPLLEAMDRTGEDFAPEIDEFAAVGLTAVPSVVVRPPRIAEAPIHFRVCARRGLTLRGRPSGFGIARDRRSRARACERRCDG